MSDPMNDKEAVEAAERMLAGIFNRLEDDIIIDLIEFYHVQSELLRGKKTTPPVAVSVMAGLAACVREHAERGNPALKAAKQFKHELN